MKYTSSELQNNFLYHSLRSIQKKPGLWLGKKSLQLLDCYMNGCILGYMSKNGMDNSFYKWYEQFKKYICKICVNGNECYGAVNAILACGFDDETGFDYFFELLDLFLKEYGLTEKYEDERESSYLQDEIRIAYLDKTQIQEIVGKYIAKYKEELFNLPKPKANKSFFMSDQTNLCLYLEWLSEENSCICAIYDRQYINIKDVLRKIEQEIYALKKC